MLMLDTDILIDVQRGHVAATTWFQSLTAPPDVPFFVLMELMQAARSQRELMASQILTAPLGVFYPSQADCQRALRFFEAFHLSQGLGLIDALIAACAEGAQASLCTFNVKHYRAVPGLNLLQPYTR